MKQNRIPIDGLGQQFPFFSLQIDEITGQSGSLSFPRNKKEMIAVIRLLKNVGIFMSRSNVEDYTIRML